MITRMEKAQYVEVINQACEWFMRNQNTDEQAWGGVQDSSDKGRYIYEWFPAIKSGRGGVVWTQALGIMALDAANIRIGSGIGKRIESIKLAARYMLNLQHLNEGIPENYGAFAEGVIDEVYSFPRDASTGGLGLCALYRLTGEQKYLDSALLFAEWYRNYGCDDEGWPYIVYNFADRKGTNTKGSSDEGEYVKGDWQAGGGLFYYHLSAITGERKYIDDYLLPMMPRMMKIYRDNPPEKVIDGFHGQVPVSTGNDDFALVTLLAAFMATKDEEYLSVAHERIAGLLTIMDKETGRFPSFGGTFVCGITMHVLNELDKHLGNEPDDRLVDAVELIAKHGVELQARDYNDVRVHGGFWGQTNYGVGRDWIHNRSTGYATIFYAMISGDAEIPYYNCLHWDVPKK